MKIYFEAFIGALFFMLFVGILTEGLVGMILDFFHTSKHVVFSAETAILLLLLIAFSFMFRHTLQVEKDLDQQGY